MILVAVGYDKSPYLLGILLQMGEIGDYVVDAGSGVIREHYARVDYQDVFVVLDAIAILAYFLKSAQGVDLHWRIVIFQRVNGSRQRRPVVDISHAYLNSPRLKRT